MISLALLLNAILYFIRLKKRGLYIHNQEILYKSNIFSRRIDSLDIKCIRLDHATYRSLDDRTKYLKDHNGNTLYYMYFYGSFYEKDEMNSLEFIEEIKRSFVEKKLASCIYDKEALDYILSLNPDIKVFYPKDF
jgi:hypothetical protein